MVLYKNINFEKSLIINYNLEPKQKYLISANNCYTCSFLTRNILNKYFNEV